MRRGFLTDKQAPEDKPRFGRIREEIGTNAFNAKLRDTLLAALQ